MRTNPFHDTWLFLIGSGGDFPALGVWRWFFVALLIALLASSAWIAVTAWREEPDQRTSGHLATWFMRTFVGCMWFQGTLWKLPLGDSNGLRFWTEQMKGRAAFEWHRQLVADVILPNFALLDPLVFLTELAFAISLMLGFGVRYVAAIAVLFVLQLWLGLYVERPGDIAEWPWNYIFLAFLMAMFGLHDAGRSLGLDALLHRRGRRSGARADRPIALAT